jgi:hypothetical protein
MTRRALVLALAFATLASPLALTMCQVLCADHAAAHASGAPAGHSCHEEPPSGAAATITAVPHACGHAGESPAGLEQWVQAFAAPLAVIAAASWTSPPSIEIRVSGPVAVDFSPPGPFVLIAQLRV